MSLLLAVGVLAVLAAYGALLARLCRARPSTPPPPRTFDEGVNALITELDRQEPS